MGHCPPSLDAQAPLDLKVPHNIPHPHQHRARAQGDEDADHHYHCHGERPLVEIVPGEWSMCSLSHIDSLLSQSSVHVCEKWSNSARVLSL